MDKTRCCVCHQLFADEDVRWLGGRSFCAEHHARALDVTRTHWSRAGLVESLLVALFVLGVALIFGSQPLPVSVDVGLGLALVPAVIWMVFIYRQDRVEPEPVGLVIGVFLLGWLLAAAVQGPVLEVFELSRWRHHDALAPWIAAVAVEGTVGMLCAYLAVRYSVFFTNELDEPVDGVIYATAASLGIATASNVDLVVHHHGVLPLAGATTMASTALVHVAAGVVLGYGISRRCFDRVDGHRWMTLAFVASVMVRGGFQELVSRAGAVDGSFDPTLGFSVAFGLGLAVLAGSHVLTMRFAREALEQGRGGFHE